MRPPALTVVKSVDLKKGACLKRNTGLVCSTVFLPHLH